MHVRLDPARELHSMDSTFTAHVSYFFQHKFLLFLGCFCIWSLCGRRGTEPYEVGRRSTSLHNPIHPERHPSNRRTMSLPSTASKAEVHTAWLAAGAKGDAAPMRELHSQFPEWLDFNQVKSHLAT